MNENIYSRMSSVFNVGNKSTEETLIESGKATGINDDVAVVAVSPALDNCQNYTETNNSSMNQKSESSIFPDEAVKFSCTHFELQPNPKTKELSLKEFEDLIKSQNMSSDEPKRKRKRKRSLPSKIVNSSENFQTEKNPRYLTHDQRMEIIELCQQKNSPSKRELGRMFNVSDAAIRKTLLKKEEILKLDKEINGEKNLDRIENNTNLIISDSDLIKSSTEHSFTALPAIKVKKLLSLGQKLEIISLLLSSKLQTEVENQFDVTRECIDEIWVKRHDILMKASQKLSDVYSDEKSEQSSNENSVDSVIDKPIEKEPFVSPPSLVSFQNASLNFTPDLSKPILKPNYTRLTIAQKLEIIKILCEPCQGKKPSMRKVGKMYGVTDGSIRKVVRDKETIIANSKLVNEEFKNTRTKFTPARYVVLIFIIKFSLFIFINSFKI